MLSSMKGVKMAGLTEKLTQIIQNLRITEVKSANKFRMIMAYTTTIGKSFIITFE
jgi:ATP-binding cassette subfamily C (CFTR/MRP) protein 1